MAVIVHKNKKSLDGSSQDFLITTINYDDETKLIMAFSALQIFEENKENHQIIKYDTAHEIVHAHQYFTHNKIMKILPDYKINIKDYELCKRDIKENWQKYKLLYIRNHLKRRV